MTEVRLTEHVTFPTSRRKKCQSTFPKVYEIIFPVGKIEITSWKARAYGFLTRVGEVSEIERVSTANE